MLAAHLHHEATTATLFYGLVNVLMAASYSALWFYAARGRRLIAPTADQRTISGISRAFLPGVPLYTFATLTAFISAWIAVSLFIAYALFYVLESSLLGRAD